MAPNYQTDPRYILPAGSNTCHISTCWAYERGTIFAPHWRLNEHMKMHHGWPRGFTQPVTDSRTNGTRRPSTRQVGGSTTIAPATAAAAITSTPDAIANDVGSESEDGDQDEEAEEDEEDEEDEEAESETSRGSSVMPEPVPLTTSSIQDNGFVWLMRTVRPALEASQAPSAPLWLAEIDFFEARPQMVLEIIARRPSSWVPRLFRLGNALEAFRIGQPLPEPIPISVRLFSSSSFGQM